jgi:hypothetical protein
MPSKFSKRAHLPPEAKRKILSDNDRALYGL